MDLTSEDSAPGVDLPPKVADAGCDGEVREILHVYFDDYEWWVASSAVDARAQQEATHGCPTDVDEWSQLPDDKVLTMLDDDEVTETKKTCAEWARDTGRGFLGGTEY
jgi:hypothetical protein